MKQMDEMERSIQLRSEERGYRAAVLALCAWTLFHSWQTLFHGAEYHPLPSLILCFAVSVQSFSQIALKQKTVSGDEEHLGPNQLLRAILLSVAAFAAVVSPGVYFLTKA